MFTMNPYDKKSFVQYKYYASNEQPKMRRRKT